MDAQFQAASRLKLRFDTPKGQLTVEDLWDLPLTSGAGKANLDDIAKSLHRQTKTDDVSFVTPPAAKDASIALAFDIVKHIIGVRIAERDAAADAAARAAKKQQLLSLIASKESEALAGKSLDELRAMFESL